ncbi:hypothetical protein A3Q56_04400 [Intoshia linei]|uniref:Tetraspanin n=1 Tax=Intoshia linei TaxID=1819745 RepID=A0A177B0V6_9BILA|nr:hypothetical protein A3Q56_04400 [Intoshia linei]
MAQGNGLIMGLSKIIIIVINVVISLIGLAGLIFGIVFKAGLSNMIFNLILSVEQQQLLLNPKNLVGIDVSTMSEPLSIPLIIMGLFLFLTGIFGCCGICFKKKIFLILYTIIISVLVFIQIIIVIVLCVGTFTPQIKSKLVTTIKTFYHNSTTTTSFPSIVWNALMAQLKCCGVNNHTDFDGAINYNSLFPIINKTKYFPMVCCRNVTKMPSCALKPFNTTTSFANISRISKGDGLKCFGVFFQEIKKPGRFELFGGFFGCWTKLANIVSGYGPIAMGVAGSFIAIQCIIILICIYLICKHEN